MQFSSAASLKQRKSLDAIILPVWQEKKGPVLAAKAEEFSSIISAPLESGDFRGKEGETILLYLDKGLEKKVLLLGLGNEEKCTEESLRKSYASATKLLQKKNKGVNLLLPECEHLDSDTVCKAICEGVLLSNYTFDSLKGDAGKEEGGRPVLAKICMIGGGKNCLAVCEKTLVVISSVNFARDLVNSNADDVTPERLGREAKRLEKEFSSIKATVFNRKQIEKEKMGLLLAVSKGAEAEPAFIILEYRGNPRSKESTAIIGKGITFDTGGLNIKQTGQMETMKCDMAGSAAILGTIQAAAALKLKVNLLGFIASTENAIGPKSYKPGDVYKSLSGKTVEIANTDAEGRLVLADAITYALENYSPDRVIDLATLTGGIVIALGEEATGLFSNDDALAEALTKAGEKTYERLWRFPLYAEYKDALKSPIADMKNSGGRKASSITAAVFLQQFVKDGTPWAHLDIAGTAYLSELKPYHTTHATGVGIRLLIEFLEGLHQ